MVLTISSLAHMEACLGLACIFRTFCLMLYETDCLDVEMLHDFFSSSPKQVSTGIRVKLAESYDI
jgi:hypothetical protein